MFTGRLFMLEVSHVYLRTTRRANVIKPMMKPAKPKNWAVVSQFSKGKAKGASE